MADDRRAIPIPTTVSPELQSLLVNADVPALPPFPTTNDGWMRYLAEPEAQRERIASLLTRFGVGMARERIGGVDCFRVTPTTIADRRDRRLIVHAHGGGYVLGGGEGGTAEAIMLASAAQVTVITVDYRMPPDHPYPAAIDDVMAVWEALLKQHDAGDLALGGTSAGAALMLLAAQRMRSEGLPMPGAMIAGSPWSDMSRTGDSYYLNEITRVPLYDGALRHMAELYADGLDLRDPRLSPVYGDFAGFPATLLISGTRDIFLSNAARVQRKLLDAGAPVELIVYEGQSHAAYLNPDIPESIAAFADMARFLDRHW